MIIYLLDKTMTTKQVNENQRIDLQLDPAFFKWNRIKQSVPTDPNARVLRYINVFERITVPEDGGILRHYAGLKYPRKGFPFPEAINAIDIVKAYTMSVLYTVGQKELKWSILGFVFLSWKKKLKIIENALNRYIIFSDRVMNVVRFRDGTVGPIYLQKQYYSNFARELWKLIANFLIELGINESTADRVGEIIATLFEYDDAYRYRMEDIMSETDKWTLRTQPRAELKRLGAIMIKRDHIVGNKFDLGIKVLRMVLLSGKIRQALRMAIFMSDFKNLQYDDIDRHCVLQYAEYDFMGTTEKEREAEFLRIYGDNLPPVIEVDV